MKIGKNNAYLETVNFAAKTWDYIREALTTEGGFEWMHQNLARELIPCEIIMVSLRRGKEYRVTGYTRDLRKDKKMLREIEYKDTLLQAVNTVAITLSQAETDQFHGCTDAGNGRFGGHP